MEDEKFIRNQIQKILLERDRRVGQRSSRSGQRSPGVRRIALEKGALAEKNPEALIKKLNIGSALGDTTAKKVLSVLTSAVSTLRSKEDLRPAFSGISDEGDYILIQKGDISAGEAIKYINHILIAAENAGVLSRLDKPVIVREIDGDVVVLFDE